MIPPETNALVIASQWLAEVATGSIAIGIATIAVAGVGFGLLAGRVDIRRGATAIIGCFILFGAPSIVNAFMQWAFAGGDQIAQASYAPPLAATPSPPPDNGNDPYAGASLIR